MKTTLLLGIHNHQPVDNFDYVLKNAILKSYKPFLQVLKKFPTIKISAHFSGWLIEYIEKNDKELFSLIQELSPQIEFFSGGYYEPILASIPSEDRVAQILMLNRYIEKKFKQKPKGLWLTERVWDSSIIKDLKKCGIEYVIVDDYHLIASGYEIANKNGYFLTENDGEAIAIFPINKALRYAIPFTSVKKSIELLESFQDIDGQNGAILFDDGEKFGVWPKTYELVYDKKWLESFFEAITQSHNIETQTYKEFYKSNNPLGLVYLQNVSYEEMGEWSLKADEAHKLEELNSYHSDRKEFIKGGMWKNFFNKYQESNWIHKRVLELSQSALESNEYKDYLYRAQANDTLWHGVFGGIYLPNLRDTTYKYIIKCEKLHEDCSLARDIDIDGKYEYKFFHQNCLTIVSKNGGQIYELDLLDNEYNLQNTLSRYKELYHSKIVVGKEPVVEENDELETIHKNVLYVDKEVEFIYDWYFKKSSIEHISDESLNIDSFYNNSFRELGDFANQEFAVLKFEKNRLKLARDGGIYINGIKNETKLNKTYKFKDNSIKTTLTLSTELDESKKYFFEYNFHFADYSKLIINGESLVDKLTYKSKSLTIKDSYLNKEITFKLDSEYTIYVVKLDSLSQNESGIETINQGVSIAFVREFTKELSAEYKLTINTL